MWLLMMYIAREGLPTRCHC